MFVTSIVILIERIYYSHNLKSNFPVFFSLCIYRTKIQFKQNMAFEDYIYIRVHSPFSYLILRVYNIMPLNVKFSVYFNGLLIMRIYVHVLCFTESFTTPGRFFFTEGIHCWMGEIFHPVWLSPQTIHATGDITGRETSWECPAKEDTGGGESCQKGLWPAKFYK